MERKQAVTLLEQNQKELSERYHVASLILFGSVARDEARPESDVGHSWWSSVSQWVYSILSSFNNAWRKFLALEWT